MEMFMGRPAARSWGCGHGLYGAGGRRPWEFSSFGFGGKEEAAGGRR